MLPLQLQEAPPQLPLFRTSRKQRAPLGQLLVGTGALTRGEQNTALKRQSRFEARLGDILLANRVIDRTALMNALAQQFGVGIADLDRHPPDRALVVRLGAETCLRHGILPWRDRNGTTVIATSRPEEFGRHHAMLAREFGDVDMALTGELDLHRAVSTLQPETLIARAETRVPEDLSCREMAFDPSRLHPMLWLAILLLAAVILAAPIAALQVLSIWAIVTLVACTALKAAALIATLRTAAEPPPDESKRPVLARLPRVSVLVALYEEPSIASRLVERLERLDYPRELLDICLIVEAEDTITRAALDAINMPHHMRAIVVPPGKLKTKPRALNYALDFWCGTLVGVYDAEDAPAPDQILQVVQRFHERGSDLACVQAVLDFYNCRSNWLARCFAIEYAAWFRVVLPGMARLGLVPPLGGTSLFFRRSVLEELGGWDAHNVTEDADLGIRLARFGYRTEFIDSVTAEEANARAWPWIRQRSRWMKGYMMTWLVHMRQPLRLWRELGAWRFAGVQLLFLGTLSQFLLAPLLWIFWLMLFGVADHPLSPLLGHAGILSLIGIFLFTEVVSLTVNLYAIKAPSHRHLAPWVITMHGYMPLAAIATYRGLLDLLARPFYWDKTAHGIFAPTEAPQTAATEAVTPLRRFRLRRA